MPPSVFGATYRHAIEALQRSILKHQDALDHKYRSLNIIDWQLQKRWNQLEEEKRCALKCRHCSGAQAAANASHPFA